MGEKLSLFAWRARRVRTQLKQKAGGRPRLSVHRSSKHIYAQVIDDNGGVTLAAASTLDKVFKEGQRSGSTVDAARFVGTLLAERALKAGVDKVVFDRGGFLYHGRIRALAEAARGGGLNF